MNRINNKVKAYLILFIFCFTTNLAFEKTKNYHYHFFEGKKITNTSVFSKEQFESILLKLSDTEYSQLPKALEVKYLYIFPEKTILFIYLGYFISLSGLILNIGVDNKKNNSA